MRILIESPYETKLNEYKGQLHSHTTNSDGADTPAVLEAAYRDVGCHFIVITDHNFKTPDPSIAGILHIDGVEDTATEGHIVSLGAGAQAPAGNAQSVLDFIVEDDAMPIMAHPNHTNGWSDAELEAAKGYLGIEVYNDFVAPNELAEDKWDTLLSKGIRSHGLAVDDCHNKTVHFDIGRVVVAADTFDVASILQSLMRGNFYSTTGPSLAVSVANKVISVTTGAAATIEFIGTGGAVLQTKASATSDSYTIQGDEVYVRVRVTRDSDSKKAWSNPVYVQQIDIKGYTTRE